MSQLLSQRRNIQIFNQTHQRTLLHNLTAVTNWRAAVSTQMKSSRIPILHHTTHPVPLHLQLMLHLDDPLPRLQLHHALALDLILTHINPDRAHQFLPLMHVLLPLLQNQRLHSFPLLVQMETQPHLY